MPSLRTDHRKIRDLYRDRKILMLTMRDAFVAATGGEINEEEIKSPFASASDAPLRI